MPGTRRVDGEGEVAGLWITTPPTKVPAVGDPVRLSVDPFQATRLPVEIR